jgi:two-component system nitrogen regulation sensor histidine kinase GlnL
MPAQSLKRNAKAGYEGVTFENMLRDYFSCGMLTLDSDGDVVACSPEAERMLRLCPAKKLSLKNFPAAVASIIGETLRTGKASSDRRITFVAGPADSVTLSVTVMPVSKRKDSGVVVWLREFSAAAKFDQILRRLDRLSSIGTLSAGLAHEIRNALVAVKTFVDLLLEKNQDAELSETVRREIGRMDSIVGQMLKFTSPFQAELSRIHVHDSLEHSLRMTQSRVGARPITLQREFRASDDLLMGDDRQLEQAFLNLLFNAIESIGADGAVTISTDLVGAENGKPHDGQRHTRQLRIRISDTGAGIAPENLTRIFEPFFTTKPRGTGLGLAITRQIIEEHRGSIHVESQVGIGSTFTIIFPAATPAN